jgi:hypothetical protein
VSPPPPVEREKLFTCACKGIAKITKARTKTLRDSADFMGRNILPPAKPQPVRSDDHALSLIAAMMVRNEFNISSEPAIQRPTRL